MNTIAFCVAFGVTCLFAACTSPPTRNEDARPPFKLFIVSIVEIEPISQLRRGFLDGFRRSQFSDQVDLSVEELNAQGDVGLINQIADRVATEQPNLVYVLGTPVAQAIQKRAPNTLLVQGAVTDPVAAGLADSWERPGKRYLATSDLPPVETQLDLIAQLTPTAKRIGVVYNPGEANSAAVIQRLRDSVKRRGSGLALVERGASNIAEIGTALQSLIGRADAIYLPPDNTAHAAITVIGQFARDNRIPLYATVNDALDQGALAALSLDFLSLGEEAAELAIAALEQRIRPEETAIRLSSDPTITISAAAAERLGLKIDQSRLPKSVVVR